MVKSTYQPIRVTKIAALLISILFSNLSMSVWANTAVDYPELVRALDKVMHQYHYNPQELSAPDYQKKLVEIKACAEKPVCSERFLSAFKEHWQDGPFSHVDLVRHQGNANELANYLDQMRVGEQAAFLEWDSDIAVLTINTMMGQDTIETIEAAYAEISRRGSKAIIIDLRQNEGGAFAIRPLVSHLINTPLDVGYFVSQKWFKHNQTLPSESQLTKLEPWQGWSIVSFWNDVIDNSLIKVRFSPQGPGIEAPVFILTSSITASAAELATDALKAAGRVTLVGEQTAGKMLSQKPFDLPYGYQIFLPVADYYSMHSGRLEGNPIQPDVSVAANEALAVAKKMIANLQ